MPQFIKDALEAFLKSQGVSLVKSALMALLGLIVAHVSVFGIQFTNSQLLNWSNIGATTLVTFLIHLFDHNYANPDAAPAATAPAAAVPNAPAPVAALPIQSAPPSAQQ